MNARILMVGLAATLATTTAVTASAAPTVGRHFAQGQHAARADTPKVFACDGGKPVSMQARIVNSPFTFVETAVNDEDQAVPGAAIAMAGPKTGAADTVLVTFSAESQLTGGDVNDWMGLEVHLDGVPINPFTAAGDVVAFTGEPSWNANSLQFCTKLKEGRHKFQVFANLHDSSGSHDLSGWLDDYTVTFQRFS
jgi:hypothetical protein